MSKNNEMEIKTKSWYFTKLQNLILEDDNLGTKEKIVYVIISKYADNNSKTAFPSIKTIAGQAGYSSRDTVHRAINKLVYAGYINKEKRTDKTGRDTSNLYEIKDIGYIYDLKKFAKDNKNQKLLNAINSRLRNHPIPTYEEVMNLYSELKKEDKEKKQKEELKEFYESGYR